MNDERLKAQQDRVHPLFDAWSEHLRLSQWNIHLNWKRTGGAENHHGGVCLMEVTCDWRYEDAQITIYATSLEGLDDDELEETVIHELTHILVAEMTGGQEDAHDHEEHVVTRIARAFFYGSRTEDSPDGPCISDDAFATIIAGLPAEEGKD